MYNYLKFFNLKVHEKPVADFEFSPLNPDILASTTKTDGIIRIWKLDYDINAGEMKSMDVALSVLCGHEKKVDSVKFHPTVPMMLASSSRF